jgi:hypothetical protein
MPLAPWNVIVPFQMPDVACVPNPFPIHSFIGALPRLSGVANVMSRSGWRFSTGQR